MWPDTGQTCAGCLFYTVHARTVSLPSTQQHVTAVLQIDSMCYYQKWQVTQFKPCQDSVLLDRLHTLDLFWLRLSLHDLLFLQGIPSISTAGQIPLPSGNKLQQKPCHPQFSWTAPRSQLYLTQHMSKCELCLWQYKLRKGIPSQSILLIDLVQKYQREMADASARCGTLTCSIWNLRCEGLLPLFAWGGRLWVLDFRGFVRLLNMFLFTFPAVASKPCIKKKIPLKSHQGKQVWNLLHHWMLLGFFF